MKIAVQGCCHGDLDKIYATIQYAEQLNNFKVDLLIICGDFQAVRNVQDLNSMSVPDKYKDMKDFYKYYSGEKQAPLPTLFIGGNHEASNHSVELYYGGWVCPNIYFLGFSGVVNFGGLRIAGFSGIYNEHHYNVGYFEQIPFSSNHLRSIYHLRSYEAFKLMQLKQPIDVFLSHDWPSKITNYGNVGELLKYKKHFKEEIQSGTLGSPIADELLFALKPKHWFAAHLHCKFTAVVPHSTSQTKFLALDKCLPKRDFLQFLDIDVEKPAPNVFSYDAEWLAILRATNAMLPLQHRCISWKAPKTVTIDQAWITAHIKDLTIPTNFVQTCKTYDPNDKSAAAYVPNNQTRQLLTMLQLDNLWDKHYGIGDEDTADNTNPDEIDIVFE